MGKYNKKTTKCKSSLRPSPVRLLLSMLSHPTQSRTLRLRSRTRKVSHQISKDLSSLVSSLRTAAPCPTTTFKRSPLFTWSSDFVEVCKSSLRLSPARPSPLTSSHLILSRMLRPRSRTRKVSLQTSRDSSSLVSSSKTVAPCPTTTFKRSPLFTWSSDFVEACKSSLRPSPARPSPSTSSHLTQLRTSRPRSRTRKVSLQTSKDSSSLVSSSKTVAPCPTT